MSVLFSIEKGGWHHESTTPNKRSQQYAQHRQDM